MTSCFTLNNYIWAKKDKFYRCVNQDGIWPDSYQAICGRVIVISQEDGSSQYGEITWHDNDNIHVQPDNDIDSNIIKFSINERISTLR